MGRSAVERELSALSVARSCASLGARPRTIMYVTGLPREDVIRLLFDEPGSRGQGRLPASPDWLCKRNLFASVEASVFACIFRRMRELRIGPPEALVGAYVRYREWFLSAARKGESADREFLSGPRLNFDRAFCIVCQLDGIWAFPRPSLSLLVCGGCTSHYVAQLSGVDGNPRQCPFCKLLRAYDREPRYQAWFPPRVNPALEALASGLLARWPSSSS